jgi:hypothetical protein
MADRKLGLDAAHCHAAIHELALLHALSLAMKLCHPHEFTTRVAACVKEAVFAPENEDWYREYYRAATHNALTMVSIHYTKNTSSLFIQHRKHKIPPYNYALYLALAQCFWSPAAQCASPG